MSETWDNILNEIKALKEENNMLRQENEKLKERIIHIYEEFEVPKY